MSRHVINHKSICPGNIKCKKCGRLGCNGCIHNSRQSGEFGEFEKDGLCLICSGQFTEEYINLHPVPKGDWDFENNDNIMETVKQDSHE